MSSRLARLAVVTALLSSVTALTPIAEARPGSHPAAISTYDTRASSVVLAYRRGILDGGGFNHISYNANFTSTTGVLSAQFGLHYLNFKGGPTEDAANGVAGGAVALFNVPVTRRFDNGLPVVGIAPYLGIIPTAIISGEQSFLTLPAVLGLAAPMSPAELITITPWFEVALAVDLDTVIRPASITQGDVCNIIPDLPGCPGYVPGTIPNAPPPAVTIDASTVTQIVAQGVEVELSVNAPMRFGLDTALHVGDALDFTIYGGMATFGSAFGGTMVGIVGGSLVWRWDDIVPGVLPAERRLLKENCEDIEARFRTCPASRTWLRPEQIEAERKAQKEAAKPKPTKAPISPPTKQPKPTIQAPEKPPAPATPPPPAAPAPAAPPPAAAPPASAPPAPPLPPADFPR